MEAIIKYSTYWAKTCLHVDFSMYLKKMSIKEKRGPCSRQRAKECAKSLRLEDDPPQNSSSLG